MLPLPPSPSLSTFAATRSLSFGQLAALSLSASRKYVKRLRSCGCACVADFSRERECCTCVLCVCERVLVCLPACECVRERVCSCARLPVRVCMCVWCAVAGLLEERSTFVFDFSFRSARFDVQECSSRGMARQEPRYRVSSTCVPQMYYTYVAKQGEHCSQNNTLLLQCSHFSVQLISSASTNPHRTLLSRSPCMYICVCVYAHILLFISI